MGRQKQVQIPTEVGEALARFKAWRMTRKNGTRIPEDLWSEAAELARRFGINRVSLALGLCNTTLKEHVEKGQVAAGMVPAPRSKPMRHTFVEVEGGCCPEGFPGGAVLELTRPEGERLVLRWPAGNAVDACGLVAAFLGRVR